MVRLRAAGIETAVGPCEAEARRLNEGFARWSQHRRPLVLMKVAMTLDGRIAPPPGQQAPHRALLDHQRGCARRRAAAALAGRRGADRRGHRAGRRSPAHRPQRSAPPQVSAARGAGLGSAHAARLQDGGHGPSRRGCLYRFKRRGSHSRTAKPAASASKCCPPRLGASRSAKSWTSWATRAFSTLLTETGTRLNTALLAGGLVDRVHLFVSPQIMGSDAVPAFRGMASAIRMAEVEVERYGNDLGLCSLLRDPWPAVQLP